MTYMLSSMDYRLSTKNRNPATRTGFHSNRQSNRRDRV